MLRSGRPAFRWSPVHEPRFVLFAVVSSVVLAELGDKTICCMPPPACSSAESTCGWLFDDALDWCTVAITAIAVVPLAAIAAALPRGVPPQRAGSPAASASSRR